MLKYALKMQDKFQNNFTYREGFDSDGRSHPFVFLGGGFVIEMGPLAIEISV